MDQKSSSKLKTESPFSILQYYLVFAIFSYSAPVELFTSWVQLGQGQHQGFQIVEKQSDPNLEIANLSKRRVYSWSYVVVYHIQTAKEKHQKDISTIALHTSS